MDEQDTFTIETEVDDNRLLVPPGWRWDRQPLPA